MDRAAQPGVSLLLLTDKELLLIYFSPTLSLDHEPRRLCLEGGGAEASWISLLSTFYFTCQNVNGHTVQVLVCPALAVTGRVGETDSVQCAF